MYLIIIMVKWKQVIVHISDTDNLC